MPMGRATARCILQIKLTVTIACVEIVLSECCHEQILCGPFDYLKVRKDNSVKKTSIQHLTSIQNPSSSRLRKVTQVSLHPALHSRSSWGNPRCPQISYMITPVCSGSTSGPLDILIRCRHHLCRLFSTWRSSSSAESSLWLSELLTLANA